MNSDRRRVHRQVAELHAQCIDGGFLSTLGPRFLALLYEAIDASPDGVLLVEEDGGHVNGFISGAGNLRTIRDALLRRPLRLGLALLPALTPRRLARIVETLRYTNTDADGLPTAELLSIAVAPANRGCGIAERLYRRLSSHWQQRGVEAFRIVVGDGLAPAQKFYRRMGAVPAGQLHLHAGQGSTVFVAQTDQR